MQRVPHPVLGIDTETPHVGILTGTKLKKLDELILVS